MTTTHSGGIEAPTQTPGGPNQDKDNQPPIYNPNPPLIEAPVDGDIENKSWWTTPKKIGVGVVAIVAATSMVATSLIIGNRNNSSENAPATGQPPAAAASRHPGESVTEAPDYSPEVQQLLTNYPDHFDGYDARTVYAVLQALELTGARDTIIPNVYFKNYSWPNQAIGESDLTYEKPIYPNTYDPEDPKVYQDILNDDFIPDFNVLMGQLAMNPTPEQRSIIMREFIIRLTSGSVAELDPIIADLDAFVQAHGGPTSTFTMAPAVYGPNGPSLENDRTNSIIINDSRQVDSVSEREDGILKVVSRQFSPLIDVSQFDINGYSEQSTYRLSNGQFLRITRGELPAASTSSYTAFSLG